jgi:hypothetical protein
LKPISVADVFVQGFRNLDWKSLDIRWLKVSARLSGTSEPRLYFGASLLRNGAKHLYQRTKQEFSCAFLVLTSAGFRILDIQHHFEAPGTQEALRQIFFLESSFLPKCKCVKMSSASSLHMQSKIFQKAHTICNRSTFVNAISSDTK